MTNFYYFLLHKFTTTCINLSYFTVLNYLSLEIWLTSIIQTIGKSRKLLAFTEPNYQ